ncbi:sigma 54-interacting transcriptional regulator [Maledivibacter halophilus]|uniref:Arginine utilization regulatory protein n=1 Tax=Maledivibacter halophilus TaxID=36842 RepID=A0A1T5IKH0_9FIRM|nr:sigma 54-interacting transcriptional regulator [Maledivibacter halophilus]SKC39473.1 arginine utilization regulatory protein [Maledivibacter halophilus]
MEEKYDFFKKLLKTIFTNIQQGIIILEKNNILSCINPKAAELLEISVSDAIGRNFEIICPELFIQGKLKSGTFNLINGKKIKSTLIASIGLSRNDKKVLFLQTTSIKDEYDILKNIVNSIDEAIMACDHEGRLIIYNDANQKLDNLLREKVLGQLVTNIYNLTQENSLLFQAMKERKPIQDKHQSYTTCTGKKLNIVCNTYPLFRNSKVVGAVSIMRDYSKIKELSDKILDLQEQLHKRNKKNTKNTSIKSAKYTFDDIIGLSQPLEQSITWAKQAAKTDSPVLIYGETGTGKELFAQSIHNASQRASKPFIAINCAAIPENLLEGILFGTVSGSFSGAVDRPGLFEQATTGTLLLDELNSMSMGLQSKLLRVLQEGVIRRVGAIDEIPVDVRIITNINMEPYEAIQKQKLREDLFYRLSVVYLKIPSLHQHKEDIPLLAKNFISKYNRKFNSTVDNLSSDTMNIFMQYEWPGNIREFQHAIESAMNIMKNYETIILPEHLPQHIFNNSHRSLNKKNDFNLSLQIGELSNTMKTIEKQIILLSLQKNNWNVASTARKLGMKRQSLQYRMKKYNIKQSIIKKNEFF